MKRCQECSAPLSNYNTTALCRVCQQTAIMHELPPTRRREQSRPVAPGPALLLPVRLCTECGTQPLSRFNSSGRCRACILGLPSERRFRCDHCEQAKPLDAFNQPTPGRPACWCRDCHEVYRREQGHEQTP